MKVSIRKCLILTAILIVINITLYPVIAHADNDSDFSRPLYSYQEANEGAIKNITFNSIKVADTDAAWAEANGLELPVLGNETNFVGAREDTGVNAGAQNVWEGSNITVEDGKTYIVRLYVHNNASGGDKNTALDTQVRFYVPYGSATTQTVNGWLRSSNATPNTYSDTVNFNSANGSPFHLEYVSGSALLENGGFAKGNGVKLADTITNQGNPSNKAEDEWTTIGYYGLDGKIQGCYQYINYVSIRVKAVYDYDFTVDKKVRIVGDTDKSWKETVEAKVGDKVEFQIQYINTSDLTQNDVIVKDTLPSNLRYIDGSAKIYNVNHPNGATFKNGYVMTEGANIGAYGANSNAFIRFTAEVVDDNLAGGKNTMISWAQVRVGDTTVRDSAEVIVVVPAHNWFTIAGTVITFLILVCTITIIVMHRKVQHNKYK